MWWLSVVCLNGYNTVLDKENRQKNSSESSRRNWNRNSQSMQQRKAQSQTVLIKTEPNTGEAQGFGGPVDVEVIVENGMILRLISHRRKKRMALIFLWQRILFRQSLKHRVQR